MCRVHPKHLCPVDAILKQPHAGKSAPLAAPGNQRSHVGNHLVFGLCLFTSSNHDGTARTSACSFSWFSGRPACATSYDDFQAKEDEKMN